MKPNALSVAVMATLLPLAGSVRADSVLEGAQFFVSQRLWQADWEIGSVAARLTPASAAHPAPLLQVAPEFINVRKTMPLTGFGINLDRWTLSATVGWPSNYSDARIDGKVARSEYDVNLGYAITPNLSAVVVYKSGKADVPVAAGTPAAVAVREKEKLRGTGLGVSARYPLAENWNLYGSAAYTRGHAWLLTSGERYGLRYTVAETGIGYRIPGAFSNMSLTAGYRYQNLDFRDVYRLTYALTPAPVLVSTEPVRPRSATKGFTMGVAFSF